MSTVWWWGFLGLLVGLAVTLAICAREQRQAVQQQERALQQLGANAVDAIRAKLGSAELLLRAVQSVFAASDHVDEREFAILHHNLEPDVQFVGLQVLSYAKAVQDADGVRRYPVTMFAPASGNGSMRGVDVLQQPQGLDALRRAEATGEVAMSAPYRLAQFVGQEGATDGVVLRLPVYPPGVLRAAAISAGVPAAGSLGVSFSVRNFIKAAIPEDIRAAAQLQVTEVGTGPVALYDSHPQRDSADGWRREDLFYGGRHWQLSIRPLQRPPVQALVGQRSFLPGALASVLLALLVMALANNRRHALLMGHRMSRRYMESERSFRSLNELMPALVLLADADSGQVVHANRAARRRFGDRIAHGGTLETVLTDQRLVKRLQRGSEGVVLRRAETRLCAADGNRFWGAIAASRLAMDDGPRLLLVMADIQEERLLRDTLEYQARHDSLTGLYNRREFEQRLDRLVAACDARAGACKACEACGAVFYLDLDQFKLINDTSGHAAGDETLRQLAAILQPLLGENDMIARLGGDEFGIIAGTAGREVALALAERLRSAVEASRFLWSDENYQLTASIGVVLIDEPGLTSQQVMARADTACYVAKDRGRNRVHLHQSDDDDIQRRDLEMDWANRLRRALDEQRLLLDYQEVRALGADCLGGANIELLLRLRDADGNEVVPGAFLPAAENYGLMPQLDRWVIGQAIANFDRLHPAGAGLARCSINLSAASLEDEHLAADILELLRRHGVAPQRICFEITETVAVRHISQLTRFIAEMRMAGCLVALDDFGSGMSSFAYLKSLELDIIKIDGHFIHRIEEDAMGLSIVEAVTGIAHANGLAVVAEWVESEAGLAILRGIGVDYAQGRWCHKPERVVYQR